MVVVFELEEESYELEESFESDGLFKSEDSFELEEELFKTSFILHTFLNIIFIKFINVLSCSCLSFCLPSNISS